MDHLSWREREILCGYFDGKDLENPFPGSNRSPFYIHGFRNGRDDVKCSKKMRRFPSRTAEQARSNLAYLEIVEDSP